MSYQRACFQLVSGNKYYLNTSIRYHALGLFYKPKLKPLTRTQPSGINYFMINNNCIGWSNRTAQRSFHTSNPAKALPPIIWVVLRPILKFAAVITGRGIRKWWSQLPKNKKAYILDEIKKNRRRIIGFSIAFVGSVYGYYIFHVVEDPITKRRKFIIFSDSQIKTMAKIQSEVLIENYKDKIFLSGSLYNLVERTVTSILQANIDLPGINRKWEIYVIDDLETRNAFVLPSGQIFIYTGMLQVINNDHQLAAVLGHEIAHVLLNHTAETVSKVHFLEMLMLLPLVALWTLLPPSIALTSHYFTENLRAIIFELPFSRSIESEADRIGLEMIARACYNPVEASAFWKTMDKLSEINNPEWLSTHPNSKTRYETLDELMPKVFSILGQHCNKNMRPHFRIDIPILGERRQHYQLSL